MTTRSHLPLSRRLALGAAIAFALAGATLPAFSLATGFSLYSKAAFEAALKGPKPVLVHVHAGWCPVCTRQEAVFNELSGTPELQKLSAFVVDFDREVAFKKAHGVNNQSIIIIFKDGKEVARSGGETDKNKIAAFLASAVK